MVTRRTLLGTPLWAALATNAVAGTDQSLEEPRAKGPAAPSKLPVHEGPFRPTVESLKTYQVPE